MFPYEKIKYRVVIELFLEGIYDRNIRKRSLKGYKNLSSLTIVYN